MRQIALDTETTGLYVERGHKIIEIACVEIVDRRITGSTWHSYINPRREMDAEVISITGINPAKLADKPEFSEITDSLLQYIGESELIIHNAKFDIGFLRSEFSPALDWSHSGGVIDTLALAKAKYPGSRASLDAVCKKLGIDASGRSVHGALIDAQLLAKAYLALTSQQEGMDFGVYEVSSVQGQTIMHRRPRVIRASDEECALDARVIAEMASWASSSDEQSKL